jgi:hypothetical protein
MPQVVWFLLVPFAAAGYGVVVEQSGQLVIDAMPLDWSWVGTGNQEPLLRPRDIFAALPNRPWPCLRQEQGEVLEKWFGCRDDRDVVIKQNSGGGKPLSGC